MNGQTDISGNPAASARPAEQGFRLPAEFEPHARCWMAWPCRSAAFGAHFEAARSAFASVARAVAACEPVIMLANPEHLADATRRCGPGIEVRTLEMDDSWTRDTGPTFVRNRFGRVAGVVWRFNGWGGVWTEHRQDARMARRILASWPMRAFEAELVLEGGAVHVDGEGTLLAVLPCLLDPARNPGLTRTDLEEILARYLNVTRFIWLEHGLEDDETAGHVDNVACFARPGLVLVHAAADPDDGNHHRARENLARLQSATDARGRRLEVIPIEQPARREGRNGRLCLSYINFYLANGGAIIPAFDDPKDQEARRIIEAVFPRRRVIQVPALDIVHGGGGIHCVTLQQPMGEPASP
ncbi:MAG: agmatine deiminase family protein [Thermodesulfobacteriota bacterium]